MFLICASYYTFSKQFYHIALLFSLVNVVRSHMYNLHEFKDYNGRMQVIFKSDGTGQFSGPLISKNDQSSLYRLQVKKDVSVDGEITARKISAIQAIDASSLEVKSMLKTNSLKVSEAMEANEITVNQKLKINGIANITNGMSVVGDVSVGSLQAKFKVETKNLRVYGLMDSNNIDNSGSLRSKSLDIFDTANFQGTIKGNDAEFRGDIRSDKAISMNDASVKKMTVSNELDVKGKFDCSGTASFSKGIHTNGLVDIHGNLNVQKISSNSIESESILIKGSTTKGKIKLSIPDGYIDAHSIISKNGVETQTIHAENAHIKNILAQNNMTAEKIMVKYIDISKKAVMNSLSVENVIIYNDIEIKGDAVIAGSISTKDNAVIGKNIMAESGSFDQALSSKVMIASREIISRSIRVEENITSDHGKVIVYDVQARNEMKAKKINVGNINVTGEIYTIRVYGNHITSQDFNTNKITANTSLDVLGNATFKGYTSVQGDFNITNNAYVAKNVTVVGNLEANSAIVSDKLAVKRATINSLTIKENTEINGNFYIGGENFHKSNLGFKVNSQEILVAGVPFNVDGGNVTVNDSLIVGNSTWTRDFHVSNTMKAKQVIVSDTMTLARGDIKIVRGNIFGPNDFMVRNSSVSCENLYAKKVNVTGTILSTANISSTATIISKNMIVSNSLLVKGTSMSEKFRTAELQAGSVLIDKTARVVGQVELHNDLLMTSKSNITGVGKIDAKDAVIQNSLKAKSMFGKRIYTEDIKASGIISTESMIIKSDLDISGTIIGSTAKIKKKLTSSSIEITNHMSCSTAKIGSNLDAGGITTRKLNVDGDVVVNGVQLQRKLEELDDLRKRMSDLEALIRKL